jgi:hypothetical protein
MIKPKDIVVWTFTGEKIVISRDIVFYELRLGIPDQQELSSSEESIFRIFHTISFVSFIPF